MYLKSLRYLLDVTLEPRKEVLKQINAWPTLVREISALLQTGRQRNGGDEQPLVRGKDDLGGE